MKVKNIDDYKRKYLERGDKGISKIAEALKITKQFNQKSNNSSVIVDPC